MFINCFLMLYDLCVIHCPWAPCFRILTYVLASGVYHFPPHSFPLLMSFFKRSTVGFYFKIQKSEGKEHTFCGRLPNSSKALVKFYWLKLGVFVFWTICFSTVLAFKLSQLGSQVNAPLKCTGKVHNSVGTINSVSATCHLSAVAKCWLHNNVCPTSILKSKKKKKTTHTIGN